MFGEGFAEWALGFHIMALSGGGPVDKVSFFHCRLLCINFIILFHISRFIHDTCTFILVTSVICNSAFVRSAIPSAAASAITSIRIGLSFFNCPALLSERIVLADAATNPSASSVSSSSSSSALFSIADHQSNAIASLSSSTGAGAAASGTADGGGGAFQPARSVGMACRFFVPAHAHAAFVEYLYSKEAVIEIWYAFLVLVNKSEKIICA